MRRDCCFSVLLIGAVTVWLALAKAGVAQTANPSRVTEPLIIDTAGDGVAVTSLAQGVVFALNGPRQLVRTAWTTANSDDAFLAVDIDHDGRITSGLELLGGASPGPNGFATLLDSDSVTDLRQPMSGRRESDGHFDATDVAFDRLILWRDTNHDGVSQEDELESASHGRVVDRLLGYEQVSRPLPGGSMLTFEGNALVKNERDIAIYRKIYAVRFQSQ